MREIIISWTTLFFFGFFSLALTAQTPTISFIGQEYNTICEGSQWCANIELSEEVQNVEQLKFAFSWKAGTLSFDQINLNTTQITHPLPNEGQLIQTDSTLNLNWLGLSTTLSGAIIEVCWTVEEQTIQESVAQINLNDAILITPSTVINSIQNIEFIYVNTPRIRLADRVVSVLHDQVCIPVKGNYFYGVTAMGFTIDWDDDRLAFNSINLDNSDLDGLSLNNFSDGADGQLTMNWAILDNEPIEHIYDVFLYKVCFDILVQEEETTEISVMENNPELPALVYIDCRGGVTPNSLASTIDFTEEAMFLTFPDTTISIYTDLLCIPTIANNEQEILSMQLTMLWDEEVLSFNSLKLDNSQLYGIVESNFNTNTAGEILMSWFDTSLQGVEVEEQEILFETCFDVIGNIDEETLIYLGADSMRVITEVSTYDGVIGVLDIPGTVRIRSEERFIFPGDANEDKKANHFDLLNIGLGYNFIGTKRANSNINWERKYSRDWAMGTNQSNINFKHSDANGDSEIDKEDVSAILQNWGQRANIEGDQYQHSNYIGTTAMAVAPPVSAFEGNTISLPILLGTENLPTDNAYGLAFSISYEYDSETLELDDLALQVGDSWLGNLDRDLISIQKHFPEEQRIDIAITRIDHVSRNGQGEIATFDLIVEDVILLISNPLDNSPKMLKVKIHDIHLINEKEEAIAIADVEARFDLSDRTTNVQILEAHQISIHPTVTHNYLYIKSETNIEKAIVLDINGKQIQHFQHPSSRLDVASLASGTYFLKLLTKEGYTVRQFNIQ